MATTPLELYEQAYRLHYHDKRIPEAIRIYEAIIRDFPDSNECGYAVIQLQKVKASDIARALKKGATTVYPLLIVAFLSGFIALLVALVGVLLLFQQLRLEHNRGTLAVIALSKMYCGKEESALKLLDELKSYSRNDILPIELSSDIYRKHNQDAAVQLSSPPSAPGVSSRTAAQSENASQPLPGNSNRAIAPEKETAKPKSSAAKPKPAKPKKGIFLVNPDSLSYF
jgi:hypothetical protein